MGIFIHFAISKSVTQEEWIKAYEESLKLADGLNLAEYREISARQTASIWHSSQSPQFSATASGANNSGPLQPGGD